MSPLNIVLSILLFVSAVFLVVAVLLQSGKDKGVGAIGGGSSETYFGKNKGKSADKKLSLITTIVAIVFAVLALVTFIIQEAPVEIEDIPTTTTTSTNKPTSSTSSTAGSSTSDSSTGDSTTDSSTGDSTTDSSTGDNTTDSSTGDETTGE